MKNCKHKHTRADIKVIHLEDTNPAISSAEVRIICTDCKKPFEFIGFPMGMSLNQPMISADRTEIRLPIMLSNDNINFN